jgi:hypothetical protein
LSNITKQPKTVISVNKGGLAQVVPLAANVDVTFNTKQIDVLNEFDLATGRFTPKHAGYYKITVLLTAQLPAARTWITAQIVNELNISVCSPINWKPDPAGAGNTSVNGSIILYLTPANNIRLVFFPSNAPATIIGGIGDTYFNVSSI